MKIKVIALGCLITAFVFHSFYQSSQAQPTSTSVQKFGKLSIRKIFETCKRNVTYRERATAERQKIEAELRKLQAEIEAAQMGLKVVKAESPEYMEQVKELLTKQGSLQAQKEFYKQQIELKDQRWTEQLYSDILLQTKKIAEQKGFDIVFENDEPEIPSPSVSELMTIIRTHKFLYSGGCVDITDEVLAAIDNN